MISYIIIHVHINALSLPQSNNSTKSFPDLQPTVVYASYTSDFFGEKQIHLSLSH
eukprot:UN06792